MEAIFLRERGNLFPSEPCQKGFYHPSKTKNLSKNEKQTCMSPTRPCPPAASDPAATHMGIQWNLVHVPVKNISGDSSSSQFNESWPSSSELVGPSPVGESGGRQGDTLATYIHRFRHAPATSRAKREKPRETFWWKQGPTAREQHITPPKQPRDHSTPTSSGKKSVSVTPRVSSDGNDSLDERTQSLVDKSSSLLTTSTSSSLPAQKYLNTRDQRPPQTDDNDLQTAKPHPPVLTHPLRELPLNPEDDILYQWRLQRRLEEARREAAMAGEEGGVFEQRRENGRWRGNLGPPHTHMEGVTSDRVEGVTGDGGPECLNPSGVHVELQAESPEVKYAPVGPPGIHEDPPRQELAQVRPPEAKSAQVKPPGMQGATSVNVNDMPLGRTEATGGEVTAKRSVQCVKKDRDTKTEMKVTCMSELTTQHGREELPLAGRGGGGGGGGRGRPPVQYPSSPVLVRHRSRDPLHQQTTLSDSGSGDEGSQLSLTFSSEFEHTLTPRSAASQTRTEHNETSTPNIRPVLSQAVKEHLFGSPPSTSPPTTMTTHTPSSPPPTTITTHTSSPPPTLITTHTPSPPSAAITTYTPSLPSAAITTHTPSPPSAAITTHTPSLPSAAITTHTHPSPPLTAHGSPQRGTPTSKELLSAGVSDSVSCDIPWDDNMGDELLKVLIDKARLFEAQIGEIDRLLSIMSDD